MPGGAAIVDRLNLWERIEQRYLETKHQERYLQGPEWVGRAGHGTFRTYLWDDMEQMVEETTADTTTTYEYDTRQFLKSKRVGGAYGTQGTEEFRPDEMGRPYESRLDGGPGRIYESGGLLTHRGNVTYAYDKKHRMTEKVERKADGTEDRFRFEWDDWDMLAAVETPRGLRAEYLYDAFARRMQKRILRPETEGENAGTRTLLWRTDYVWAKSSMLEEIDYDGEGERTRSRAYLYEEIGDSRPLGHRDNDGEWRYYFTDFNGTPEEIIDAKGQVLGRLKRTAYGRTEVVKGSAETTQIRFPGQYEDPETGLHYNRYRYYDPDSGRYLSPDPIGIDGGHDYFAYAPNPINWYDAMGWEHNMEVSSITVGGKPRTDPLILKGQPVPVNGRMVQSGRHGIYNKTDIPSDKLTHTERKLLRALHEGGISGDELKQTEMKLKGEYPPCPNCHRAMHNFANKDKHKGMKIDYSWTDNDGTHTITYPVQSGQRTGDAKTDRLLDAYDMKEHHPRKGPTSDQERDQRDASKNYSYKNRAEADRVYNEQVADAKAHHATNGRPLRDKANMQLAEGRIHNI